MRLFSAFAVFLVLLASVSFAVTNVTTCMQINSSDTYVLQNDLFNGSVPANPNSVFSFVCMRISASNVTLDCNGFSITGNGSVDNGISANEEPTVLQNVTVQNCDVSGYHIGIYALSNLGSHFLNNTVHNNSFDGLFLTSVTNTVASGNNAFGNNGEGIFLYGPSGGNMISGNTVCGNNGNGFRMTGFYSAATNSFANNTVCNNTGDGMFADISSGLLTVNSSGNHFYNNPHDVGMYHNVSLQMTGDVFDNPAGNMANFTILSLSDGNATGGYTITWSPVQAPPAGLMPFRGRSVNISQATSGESIDSATWSWSDSEPVAPLESTFQLWRFDSGGWAALNTTPDTAADRISISNEAPGSIYSILLNATACPAPINASGSYSLTANAVGEPNDASELGFGAMACVKIGAPNVLFDCNGFNITGDGSVTVSYGVAINSSATNVTVQNCPGVSGYYDGVLAKNTNTVNLASIVPFGNAQDGIHLSTVYDSAVTGSVPHDNSMYGIEVNGSRNNATGNIAYNNGQSGIAFILNGNDSNILGNIVHDNGQHGIFVYVSGHDNVTGNIGYGSVSDGIRVESSNGNNVVGNIMFANGYAGIGLLGASGNNATGNIANGNAVDGIGVSGPNNTLDSNSAYGNGNYGVRLLSGSTGVTVTGGSMYANNQTGLFIDGASGNIVSGNNIFNNLNEGVFLRGDNNTLFGNNITNNTFYGVRFYTSSGNNVSDSNVAENGQFDVFVQADNVSHCDNSVSNVTGSGGRPINYTNATVSWSGFTSSELVLCNADGSSISGAIVNGSDTLSNNGVLLVQTDNATVNGTVSDDNFVGFESDSGTNNSFSNSEGKRNFMAGFAEFTFVSPASNLSNTVLAGNGWDIMQGSANSVLFSVDHAIIGEPSNSTSINLTITDEVGSGGGGYNINETTSPGPAPPNTVPFHDKYFKILFTGDLGINSTMISWSVPETGGFSSPIRLFAWNGVNWTLVPNQTNNFINLTVLNLKNITSDDVYGLFASAPSTPSGGGPSGGGTTPALEIGFNSSSGVITVTSGGSPVEGATVKVDGSTVGTTDQNGQITITGCNETVTVDALKSGFTAASATETLAACGAPPACTSDQNCSETESCVAGSCVAVSCPGGTVVNHACVMPQNQTNQTCTAPSCCTSSSQCLDTQACVTPSGVPASASAPGSCQQVTGQCGVAASHVFIPYNYTCGTEAGCPSCPTGKSCVAHQCVSNDITCPSTGIVGNNVTCRTTENGQACGPADNCTASVTLPDGRTLGANPDEDGNVLLPLTLPGNYTVTLLKNGQAVKVLKVSALPKSVPTEQNPPTAAGPDLFSLLWLFLLLIIVIAAVVYWRGRGQKK